MATIEHVRRLTIYVTSTGQLILSSGNCRMSITPQAASELLDELLRYAGLFHTITELYGDNGHVPEVSSK
jgi:hypothetical protein